MRANSIASSTSASFAFEIASHSSRESIPWLMSFSSCTIIGSRSFHSPISSWVLYSPLRTLPNPSECSSNRYVRASMSVGPSLFRARFTACSVASYIATASCPSTSIPGMLYADALSEMCSTATESWYEVVTAYWLFSHRNMTGSFHRDARFMDSWHAPWFDAPSPKKTIETKFWFLIFAARAAPVATGTDDATMPDSPSIPIEKSARCMEPPFPLQYPSTRPYSSAMARLTSPPFANGCP